MRHAIAALLLIGAAAPPVTLFPSADPDAEVIDGELWVFPTGARPDRLIAWSSKALTSWRMRGVLIHDTDIAWIKADGAKKHFLWAPDMVPSDGHWLLFYSVGPSRHSRRRGPSRPCRFC